MKVGKYKLIETSRKVYTIGSTCPITIGQTALGNNVAMVDMDKVCDAELELADYLGTDIYHTGAITYDRQRKELNVAYNLPRPVNYQGSKIINVCLSCVYILFCQKKIVYIGESQNPNQRIGSHIRDKLFDGYRILPTKRRKYWEKILIKRYKPKYNSNCINKVLPIIEDEFKSKRASLFKKLGVGDGKRSTFKPLK